MTPAPDSLRLLSVVIPARDEAGCIASTVEHLDTELRLHDIEHEIIVVDDGSTDETWEILQELRGRIPGLRPIRNEGRHGVGLAVRKGLEHYEGDAVVIMMADESDDCRDVVRYWRTLQEGYDCAFGSRFMKSGGTIDYPPVKYVLNRAANLFIRTLFRIRLNDTTNAFKAYRRSVIDGCMPLLSMHFNLTVELPLKAIVRGFSWTTLPITWRNRRAGAAKLHINEMGSRYFFIVMHAWLEKYFSRGDYRAPLEQRTRPPRDSSSPPDLTPRRRITEGRACAALLLLAILVSFGYAFVGFDHTILGLHAFRQTQTALYTESILRDGDLIGYELPVFGPPWRVPFEVPVYEAITAMVVQVTGAGLIPAGRVVSILALALFAWTVFIVLRQIGTERRYAVLLVALVLLCPGLRFWSRTFMIETTALAAAGLWLAATLRTLRRPSALMLLLAVPLGMIAAGAKVTTFLLFMAALGLIVLAWVLGQSGRPVADHPPGGLRRSALSRVPHLALAAGVPFVFAIGWTKLTDVLKTDNPISRDFTSSRLAEWTFGTFGQRFRLETWGGFWKHMETAVMGRPALVVLGLFAAALFLGRGRPRRWAVACVVLFLVPLFIFTNLFYVHDYYFTANGAFAMAAMGFAGLGLLERGGTFRRVGYGYFALLAVAMLWGFQSYYGNLQRWNPTALLAPAAAIEASTEPDDVIAIYGYGWNPALTFYSRRRSVMPRPPMLPDGDVVRTILQRLPEQRFAAVAFGFDLARDDARQQQAIEVLGLQPDPVFEDEQWRVFLAAPRERGLLPPRTSP